MQAKRGWCPTSAKMQWDGILAEKEDMVAYAWWESCLTYIATSVSSDQLFRVCDAASKIFLYMSTWVKEEGAGFSGKV